LELFHLFAFAEQFYFLVHLGGVLDCLEELLLSLPVLLEGQFFIDLAVQHLISAFGLVDPILFLFEDVGSHHNA
jgi:hypothetical protein